jgi:hypothetical protein
MGMSLQDEPCINPFTDECGNYLYHIYTLPNDIHRYFRQRLNVNQVNSVQQGLSVA